MKSVAVIALTATLARTIGQLSAKVAPSSRPIQSPAFVRDDCGTVAIGRAPEAGQGVLAEAVAEDNADRGVRRRIRRRPFDLVSLKLRTMAILARVLMSMPGTPVGGPATRSDA